jgi:hypothetical protein
MRAITDNNIRTVIEHDVIGAGFFNGSSIGRKLENLLDAPGKHKKITVLTDVIALQERRNKQSLGTKMKYAAWWGGENEFAQSHCSADTYDMIYVNGKLNGANLHDFCRVSNLNTRSTNLYAEYLLTVEKPSRKKIKY